MRPMISFANALQRKLVIHCTFQTVDCFPKQFSSKDIKSPRHNMSAESFFNVGLLSTNGGDRKEAERLVWIDLEMTGLDVVKDKILEIACLVTEGDLSLVAEGPNLVIHQNDSVLNQMGEWCSQHHGESGLTEAVRRSKVTTEQAESIVLEFLQKYTPKERCPVAGNSIGMDKRFLDEHMPKLSQHLHYRVVDVSTIKELCRRWYPTDFKNAPPKKLSHRAMDDIKESIEELKFYRSAIFK